MYHATVFDITDLVEHLRQNNILTGIQRVQAEIGKDFLKNQASENVKFVCFLSGNQTWAEIDPFEFLAVIDTGNIEKAVVIKNLMFRLDRIKRPYIFPFAAILINLGTCWSSPGYCQAVLKQRRAQGISCIQFIHDCIPVLFPQFCDHGVSQNYAQWAAVASFYADRFVANSENTAADFARLYRDFRGSALNRIEAIGLRGSTFREGTSGRVSEHHAKFQASWKYVLFVGTIEPRKNHDLVFSAWREMVARHGIENIPLLVCVGKWGWKSEKLKDNFLADADLQRYVRVLENLEDGDLEDLYRNCEFTVYNSFYEGWGLPVTESLSLNKICVFPDTSSLPEAAENCGVSFAVGNQRDLVRKVEMLLFDDIFRKAAQDKVIKNTRSQGWGEVSLALAKIVASTKNMGPFADSYQTGEAYKLPPPNKRRISRNEAQAEVVCGGDNWWPGEWAMWMGPGKSVLNIPAAGFLSGNGSLQVAIIAPGQRTDYDFQVVVSPGDAVMGSRKITLAANEISVIEIEIQIPFEWSGIPIDMRVEIFSPSPSFTVTEDQSTFDTKGALLGFSVGDGEILGDALSLATKLGLD
jgi:glycosyltransferase involved in cell wall biosynthesis